PSALGEGVPDTAHRHDECRRGGIVPDLAAQVADWDVDRLHVLVEGFVVAQQLQQLAPGVDPPGPTRQVAEDLELGRRQADPALASLDPPPLEIDHEIAVADHAATGRVSEVT